MFADQVQDWLRVMGLLGGQTCKLVQICKFHTGCNACIHSDPEIHGKYNNDRSGKLAIQHYIAMLIKEFRLHQPHLN